MLRLLLTLERDSDNTNPPSVAVSQDDDTGSIIIYLEAENRKLVFSKSNWAKINTVFPST